MAKHRRHTVTSESGDLIRRPVEDYLQDVHRDLSVLSEREASGSTTPREMEHLNNLRANIAYAERNGRIPDRNRGERG